MIRRVEVDGYPTIELNEDLGILSLHWDCWYDVIYDVYTLPGFPTHWNLEALLIWLHINLPEMVEASIMDMWAMES